MCASASLTVSSLWPSIHPGMRVIYILLSLSSTTDDYLSLSTTFSLSAQINRVPNTNDLGIHWVVLNEKLC
jgi:hypothetical protein